MSESEAATEAARRIIVLDTGPLGLVTHPRREQRREAAGWLAALLRADADVRLPEIADYELRRELLRSSSTRGLERLDGLPSIIGYLPITTRTMRRAAGLWAETRNRGEPTAAPEALDGDAILAAQALEATEAEGAEVVVATTNPGHLSRFVEARHWREIEAGPAEEEEEEAPGDG